MEDTQDNIERQSSRNSSPDLGDASIFTLLWSLNLYCQACQPLDAQIKAVPHKRITCTLGLRRNGVQTCDRETTRC